MNGEKMLCLIGGVDADLIEECAECEEVGTTARAAAKKKRRLAALTAGLAACLCAVLVLQPVIARRNERIKAGMIAAGYFGAPSEMLEGIETNCYTKVAAANVEDLGLSAIPDAEELSVYGIPQNVSDDVLQSAAEKYVPLIERLVGRKTDEIIIRRDTDEIMASFFSESESEFYAIASFDLRKNLMKLEMYLPLSVLPETYPSDPTGEQLRALNELLELNLNAALPDPSYFCTAPVFVCEDRKYTLGDGVTPVPGQLPGLYPEFVSAQPAQSMRMKKVRAEWTLEDVWLVTLTVPVIPWEDVLTTLYTARVLTPDEAFENLQKGWIFGGVHTCPICQSLQQEIEVTEYDAVGFELVERYYRDTEQGTETRVFTPCYVFAVEIGYDAGGKRFWGLIYVSAIDIPGLGKYFEAQKANHPEEKEKTAGRNAKGNLPGDLTRAAKYGTIYPGG